MPGKFSFPSVQSSDSSPVQSSIFKFLVVFCTFSRTLTFLGKIYRYMYKFNLNNHLRMTRQPDCDFVESDDAFHACCEQMCWLVGTFFRQPSIPHTAEKSSSAECLEFMCVSKIINLRAAKQQKAHFQDIATCTT